MFDAPADSQPNLPPPAETRAERRMRRLEQMSDMGLNIGRRLERQAEIASAHAECEAVPDNLPHGRRLDEIARAFAQVSRAVGLLTALEDRIDKGLPALPDLDRSRRFRDQAAKDKRSAVAAGVEHAFGLDPALTSPRRLVAFKLNLDRLLDQELLDLDAFLDRPLPQIVERLRRQLGLDPIGDEAELWDEEPANSPPKEMRASPHLQSSSRPEPEGRRAGTVQEKPLFRYAPGSSLRDVRDDDPFMASLPKHAAAPAGAPPANSAKKSRGRFARRYSSTRGP